MRSPGPLSRLPVGLAATMTLLAIPALAQDRVVEDIRVSAERDEATIRIELGCQMRFVGDASTPGGALLELRIAPFDACRQEGLISGVNTETYRPVGSDAAHLLEVEFNSLGLGDSLLMLSFDRPVKYEVTQRQNLRTVEVVVDLTSAPAREVQPDRTPLAVRVVEPAVTQDYMINLQSTQDTVDPSLASSVRLPPGKQLYVSEVEVDGSTWQRLRVGFFGSEAEARAALEPLAEAFPRAWIGRAEPREIELAADSGLAAPTGEIRTLTAQELAPAPGESPLDPEQIAALMSTSRDALLRGDNVAAIEGYRQALTAPGDHRAEALEFLGLAYERTGQNALARNAFEQNLREFPDGDGRARVEQRLSSLTARQQAPRDTLREAPVDEATGDWEWSLGVSQYVRRNENQFDQDQEFQTTQSALMTDLDVSLGRGGEDIDLLARLSLNHYHDLLDPAENGRGDQARISYAYFDIADTQQKWDVRLGRQSLHNWGVLGRFDGAHFSYGVGPDTRIHVTAGYPVESTRDSVETDRQFFGIAAEFTDLVGTWDIATFVNAQTVEGIDARKAVGMEARYFDDRRSVTTMLDYDLDYDEVNMILALGTWRLANRVTLSALLDQRKSPILNTRNALIGQPVQTIEEMLIVWTEDEVRQLAVDRTAESSTVTLGLATPLGERLQLNFDVTSSEIDGTVESGGVLAVPGTGVQTYYSASLVSTGLFATSDVNIWNLRFGDAENYQSSMLTWDARFPIGRRLRINPRVRFLLWESMTDTRERQTISPSLRLLLNARNRYRFELEVGRDDMTRTDINTERDSIGRYVYFGYRANF